MPLDGVRIIVRHPALSSPSEPQHYSRPLVCSSVVRFATVEYEP